MKSPGWPGNTDSIFAWQEANIILDQNGNAVEGKVGVGNFLSLKDCSVTILTGGQPAAVVLLLLQFPYLHVLPLYQGVHLVRQDQVKQPIGPSGFGNVLAAVGKVNDQRANAVLVVLARSREMR